MSVSPRELEEVISLIPAIRPNWRSSGVATEEAIVSGLAPGRLAETWIVGNSTCGRGATGRKKYATPPASATAIVRRVVPIGLRMKASETLTGPPSRPARARRPGPPGAPFRARRRARRSKAR